VELPKGMGKFSHPFCTVILLIKKSQQLSFYHPPIISIAATIRSFSGSILSRP
jgi:hypothetical protein